MIFQPEYPFKGWPNNHVRGCNLEELLVHIYEASVAERGGTYSISITKFLVHHEAELGELEESRIVHIHLDKKMVTGDR